ncbi:MAG: HisA/HisF-related TIM barrel protein, partial [Anaerolineae bacterium]
MIVFPAIDLRQGRCVRLRQGRPEAETVFSDDPVAMAEHWASQGAEWLHVINLDGAFGQASANLRVVEEIVSSKLKVQSSNFKLRIQLGGGLRTMADIEGVLGLD